MVTSGQHVPTEPGTPIRVAVVDDHPLVRSGICHALASAEEIMVVGEAGDGAAAIGVLEKESVDVLLLDIHMPRVDGLACLDVVSQRWPSLPVIILTVDEDPELALEVLRRGAVAYVPKFVRPTDLASIVRQVASGLVLMGGARVANAITRVEAPPGVGLSITHGLTGRELGVLELVAQGQTNADIARTLFVTTKTVKYHLSSIFSKLGVRNRTEAAAFALNQGLVQHGGGESGILVSCAGSGRSGLRSSVQ